MKYIYDEEKNTITVIPKPKRKVESGIRVYFSRDIDERTATDLPIATADLPKSGILEWNPDLIIKRVDVKRKRIFRHHWEIAERIFPSNNTQE